MANRPLTRAEWMAALAEAVDNFDWSGAGERKWQGLTDADLEQLSNAKLGAYDLCLEVEAKLKEKNT